MRCAKSDMYMDLSDTKSQLIAVPGSDVRNFERNERRQSGCKQEVAKHEDADS